MDVNTLRIAVTFASFVIFLSIVVWACLRRNAARFEEAALLPFTGEAGETDESENAR
jgi:cytochrome c oxidase cbb3-type subunit 4